MEDNRIQQWIEKSAVYINQLEWRNDFFEGRLLSEGQAQTLRDEAKIGLEAAYRRAKALENELRPLIMKIEGSGLMNIERPLMDAWESAVQASVSCALALENVPGPLTREKRYHQTAARLALAVGDGENAREIARQIIQAAGLDEDYSEASLTNWLRKAKETDGFRHTPE